MEGEVPTVADRAMLVALAERAIELGRVSQAGDPLTTAGVVQILEQVVEEHGQPSAGWWSVSVGLVRALTDDVLVDGSEFGAAVDQLLSYLHAHRLASPPDGSLSQRAPDGLRVSRDIRER